jgi:hypothetical protein
MAQRVVTQFYSDLSGTEIPRDGATLRFALDGTSYEIDLTTDEQQELRKTLAPYVHAARHLERVTSRRSRTASSSDVVTPRNIREWAAANGFEVPARGRIPAPVREAYESARR